MEPILSGAPTVIIGDNSSIHLYSNTCIYIYNREREREREIEREANQLDCIRFPSLEKF